MGWLREYLGLRLGDPAGVWVLDGSDYPKQWVKSVGVSRQYCGGLEKIDNCQSGVFLAHVGSRGRALVDKRLYVPKEWTGDVERWAAAGVAAERRDYRSKRELALEMLERAAAIPEAGGWEVTIAQGNLGPRICRCHERVRVTHRRQPGAVLGAIYRRNRDGSEPRYYLANVPEDTPLKPWPAWAAPAGASQPSSRPRKATWDWTSMKSALGPVGIIKSPCTCWPGLSC